MPSADNEKILTVAILKGADEYLDEIGYPKQRLLKTKMHKIVFDAAEELDLGITRSWYLRGKYVWGGQEPISAYLNSALDPSKYSTDIFNFIGLSKEIIKDAIIKATKKLNILTTHLNTYLQLLYERDAPEKYKSLYLANFTLNEKLDELLSELIGYEENTSILTYLEPEISVNYISHSIVDLHRALPSIGAVADPIIEYTTLLDEILLGTEEKFNQTRLNVGDIDFLKDIISFYDSEVWKLSATYIAKQTMVGLNKEENLQRLESKWPRLVENVENRLDEVENKAFEMGLFPSEEYLNSRTSQNELSRKYQEMMYDYLLG